jgi:hypothetical protein
MRPRLAGRESDLARRQRVYLDPVTFATPPDSYDDRLTPLFPGQWQKLELLAFEAHDLALAKLERNFERDRDDVKRLAAGGFLDRDTLIQRYHSEVRP